MNAKLLKLLIAGLFLLNACVSTSKFEALQLSKTEVQNEFNLYKIESARTIKQHETKIIDLRDLSIEQNTLISQLITDKDQLAKEIQDLNMKLGSISSEAENIQRALYEELQKQNEELGQKEARLGLIIETYNLANEKVSSIFQEVTAQLNQIPEEALETSLTPLSFTLTFSADYLFTSTLGLKSGSTRTLSKLANVLKSYPEVLILLEGHTDNQLVKPSRSYKDAYELSALRASTVARYLIREAGINSNQVTWSGKAGFAPSVSNETQAGRQLNNRVEIIVALGIEDIMKLIREDSDNN